MAVTINVVDANAANAPLASFDLGELGDVPRANDQIVILDNDNNSVTKNVQSVLWNPNTNIIQLAVVPPPARPAPR